MSAAPLIVGGGMAGAALALLLRHHGAPAVTLVAVSYTHLTLPTKRIV